MYRSHREAFAPKKGTKRPVESNLDNIINQAQIKMKEMILEKQETDRKTNLLIGQENVLNDNINFLKNEINNKKQTIASMNEKLNETKEEIKKLEVEWVVYALTDLPLALENGAINVVTLHDPVAYNAESEYGFEKILDLSTHRIFRLQKSVFHTCLHPAVMPLIVNMFRFFYHPALLHDTLRADVLCKASCSDPVHIINGKCVFDHLLQSFRGISFSPELRICEITHMNELSGRSIISNRITDTAYLLMVIL